MYFVFTFLNVRVRVVAISNFANTTFTLYHTNSEWLHYRGHACTYCTSKGYGTRVR